MSKITNSSELIEALSNADIGQEGWARDIIQSIANDFARGYMLSSLHHLFGSSHLEDEPHGFQEQLLIAAADETIFHIKGVPVTPKVIAKQTPIQDMLNYLEDLVKEYQYRRDRANNLGHTELANNYKLVMSETKMHLSHLIALLPVEREFMEKVFDSGHNRAVFYDTAQELDYPDFDTFYSQYETEK